MVFEKVACPFFRPELTVLLANRTSKIDRNSPLANCKPIYQFISEIIAKWCENNTKFFVEGKPYPRLTFRGQ